MNRVVLLIIIANALFSFKGFKDFSFFNKFKFQIGAIKQGEYVRLLSSGFLHADTSHLIFNMLTLYFFADGVIYSLGVIPFLAIYFIGLLGGGLFALIYHKNEPFYSAVGASGAVMSVIYAAILLFPEMKLNFILFPFIDIPGYVFGLGYLLYSIYGMKKGGGTIGHSAHLGGAIGGYVLTLLLAPQVLETNMILVIILGIPIVGLFIFEKRLKG